MKRPKPRQSVWIACALMAVASGVSAQVVNQDTCGFGVLAGLWYAPEPHMACLQIVEGGRTGKCVHAKNTTAQPLILIGVRPYQMELANDPIALELWCKGKGSLRVGIQPYDAGNKCVYDNTMGPSIGLDVAEWQSRKQCLSFSTAKATLAKSLTFYRLRIDIDPGSDLYLDALSFQETSGSRIAMARPSSGIQAPVAPPPALPPTAAPAKGVVREILLSTVEDIRLRTYADEKPQASPAPGNSARKTAQGVELQYAFRSDRLDACMFEFDAEIGAFNYIQVVMTGDNSKFRPFIVLKDSGGESHYFPLAASNMVQEQLINWTGKKTLARPIPATNSFPVDIYASRWGGDDNQIIDFPIRTVTLGLGKYPDAAKGAGSVAFEKIVFSVK